MNGSHPPRWVLLPVVVPLTVRGWVLSGQPFTGLMIPTPGLMIPTPVPWSFFVGAVIVVAAALWPRSWPDWMYWLSAIGIAGPYIAYVSWALASLPELSGITTATLTDLSAVA